MLFSVRSLVQHRYAMQILVATAGYITMICCGQAMTWSSPMIPLLQNATTTPLNRPITAFETSLVGSLTFLALVIGVPLACLGAGHYGRRLALLLLFVPLLGGSAIATAATHTWMVLFARLLWGIAAGGFYTLLPLYLSEIAQNEIRGMLSSALHLWSVVGLATMYAMGPFLDYRVTCSIMLGLNLLALVLAVCLFPESPSYLQHIGDEEGAMKSAKYLRLNFKPAVVKNELEEPKKSQFQLLWQARKAFPLTLGLCVFHEVTGFNLVISYLQPVLTRVSGYSAGATTTVVGCVLLLACLVAPALVERWGRRPLLNVSSMGMFVGLMVVTIYFFIQRQDPALVENLTTIPALAFTLHLIMYSVGYGPLTFTLISEIFPSDVKPTAMTITGCLSAILAFTVNLCFGWLSASVGLDILFLAIAIFCLLAFIFVFVWIPETKGMAVQDIFNMVINRNSSEPAKPNPEDTISVSKSVKKADGVDVSSQGTRF